MGFSITSPDLQRLASRMDKVNMTSVYQTAAYDVADTELEPRLTRAARAAGASHEMLTDLGTYTGADNMVYVGVPARAPGHGEAHSLEYGTLARAPQDWVGGSIASRQKDLNRKFEDALTKRLRGMM